MSSILGIGQSALAAAQAGLATTGHNIANASTPGYSRQVVVQGTAGSQNMGVGFVGKGTNVVDVRRMYNDLLAAQVRNAQTAHTQAATYHTQISRINNQFADPAAGLSPALQSFFAGVQDLAANPNLAASRQSALSSAEALASRFQSLAGQMREIEQGVNTQIQASVSTINVHAQQLAKLNDAIEKAHGTGQGKVSNDLLDQRDYALELLSKETKVTVTKQGESYNVFIGNGQPLVMGDRAFELATVTSPTDPTRLSVGYRSQNGQLLALAESSMPGGTLGGLLEFRAKSLDQAQNALGRVAIGLAMSFNAQHALGQDLQGQLGGDFFKVGAPSVQPNRNNTSSPPAQIGATIANAGQLTDSDYMLEVVAPGSYRVTRLSDGNVSAFSNFPQTIDGVNLSLDGGTPLAGDSFLIRPTINGATEFGVVIKDVAKIAAASPVRTAALGANAGTGAISAGTVTNTSMLGLSGTLSFTAPADPLDPGTLSGFPADLPISVTRGATTTTYPAGTPSIDYEAGDVVSFGGLTFSGIPVAADSTFSFGLPLTLTHADTPRTMSGFPPHMAITVTGANGNITTVAADANGSIAYQPGDTFGFAGVSFTLSGAPADGDRFTIGPNTNGVGDNRNAVLLGAIQSATVLGNGTSTLQGAYAQVVNSVGNKTRELELTGKAEARFLEQARASQQAESGVNLDEEATNLLRYQQAYQAAGKMMQTASQLFELLLRLGG